MYKALKRLPGAAALGVLALGVAAALVALWHRLETPQLLESVLPGEAHLYRWRMGHISYKTLGDPSAPPLVLVHAPALGASSHEMRKIAGSLAQHYHVYALDLLGFGLSDRPAIEYSARTYIDLLRDFLSGVIGQPATLLASGLSCNYAVMVALEQPDSCSRLVLISPYALAGVSRLPETLARLLVWPPLAFLLYPLLCTRPALRGILAARHRIPIRDVPSSEVDELYAATHQFGAEHAPLALLAGRLDIDAGLRFADLTQPVLVIWGVRAFHDALPQAGRDSLPSRADIVLVQYAGIFASEEAPAAIVENIQGWNEARIAAATSSEVKQPEAESQPAAPAEVSEEPALEAYCLKCRVKRVIADPHPVTLSNGRPAISGSCPVCGTTLYRMRQRQAT